MGRKLTAKSTTLLAALTAAAVLSSCEDAAEVVATDFVAFSSVLSPGGAGLPSLTVDATRFGRVDEEGALLAEDSLTVLMEMRNLETLEGSARYAVWVRSGGEIAPATGDYRQLRITTTSPEPGQFITDTTVVTEAEAVSSFVGGPATDVHVFRLVLRPGDPALGGSEPLVFVSLEPSGSAAAPSEARPLWASLPAPFDPSEPEGEVEDGAISATESGPGTFGWLALPDPSASRPFVPAGGGQISVRRENGTFVDLQARLRELPLPPVGYRYVAWLAAASDTVMSGAVTSPPPESVPLDEADLVRVGGARPAPEVLTTGIVEARTQVGREAIGREFGEFQTFILTLEPKLGQAGPAPSVVLSAPIPERVIGALDEEE